MSKLRRDSRHDHHQSADHTHELSPSLPCSKTHLTSASMSPPRYRNLLQLVRERAPWGCLNSVRTPKTWNKQPRRALQTSQKSRANRGGAAPTMEQMRAPFKQSNASTLYVELYCRSEMQSTVSNTSRMLLRIAQLTHSQLLHHVRYPRNSCS